MDSSKINRPSALDLAGAVGGVPEQPAARALPPDAVIGDDFLRAHCGDVLEAVERVSEWVDHEEK